MICISRIVHRIVPVHGGQFEKEIFLPLIRHQTGQIETFGRSAGPDVETGIAGACPVIFENIASEIDSGGVKSLFIINSLCFQVPFIGRLITGYTDEFIKISPKGMGQWLIIMPEIGYRIVMRIDERADNICFKLQVEVL